jgi:hypothetical protein
MSDRDGASRPESTILSSVGGTVCESMDRTVDRRRSGRLRVGMTRANCARLPSRSSHPVRLVD